MTLKVKKRKKPRIKIVDPVKNITPGLCEVADQIFGLRSINDNNTLFAVVNNKSVGMFVFSLDKPDMLWSKGTAVDPKYHKLGIATKLWKYAINKHKPKIISVSIVTEEGKRFINKLKEGYPNIDWDIW